MIVAAVALSTTNAVAGTEHCSDWATHEVYDTFDIRLCYEVMQDGTPFWFTVQYRNRSSESVDVRGHVRWKDGKRETFWALLKPGQKSAAVCTECKRHHPERPSSWGIRDYGVRRR